MASGYDLSSQVPFRLLKGRLGVYDKPSSNYANSVEGVVGQEARLTQHGGNAQQERMIRDKRRSLESALKFSYQGADVIKLNSENKNTV